VSAIIIHQERIIMAKKTPYNPQLDACLLSTVVVIDDATGSPVAVPDGQGSPKGSTAYRFGIHRYDGGAAKLRIASGYLRKEAKTFKASKGRPERVMEAGSFQSNGRSLSLPLPHVVSVTLGIKAIMARLNKALAARKAKAKAK
jgi:hypothetical protein